MHFIPGTSFKGFTETEEGQGVFINNIGLKIGKCFKEADQGCNWNSVLVNEPELPNT